MLGKAFQTLFDKRDQSTSWTIWLAENIPQYTQTHVDSFRRIWNRHHMYPLLFKAPVPMSTFMRISKKIQTFLLYNKAEARYWKGILGEEEEESPSTESSLSDELTDEELVELKNLLAKHRDRSDKIMMEKRKSRGASLDVPRNKRRISGLDLLTSEREKLDWLRRRYLHKYRTEARKRKIVEARREDYDRVKEIKRAKMEGKMVKTLDLKNLTPQSDDGSAGW
jgi:hypothetical protein